MRGLLACFLLLLPDLHLNAREEVELQVQTAIAVFKCDTTSMPVFLVIIFAVWLDDEHLVQFCHISSPFKRAALTLENGQESARAVSVIICQRTNGMNTKELKRATHTLHRYFIWANRMRVHFFDLLPKIAGDSDPVSALMIEANMYMSLWYGELYVVVEGWKELALADLTVDGLLQSQNVDLLRRYRNGAFHFQKEYFDERFIALIRDGKNVATWVHDLNRAFAAYFLNKFREWKEEAQSVDKLL